MPSNDNIIAKPDKTIEGPALSMPIQAMQQPYVIQLSSNGGFVVYPQGLNTRAYEGSTLGYLIAEMAVFESFDGAMAYLVTKFAGINAKSDNKFDEVADSATAPAKTRY